MQILLKVLYNNTFTIFLNYWGTDPDAGQNKLILDSSLGAGQILRNHFGGAGSRKSITIGYNL